MSNKANVNIKGIDLIVEFSYSPEEDPSSECEGSHEDYEITGVFLAVLEKIHYKKIGADIVTLLSEDVYEEILEEIKQ